MEAHKTHRPPAPLQRGITGLIQSSSENNLQSTKFVPQNCYGYVDNKNKSEIESQTTISQGEHSKLMLENDVLKQEILKLKQMLGSSPSAKNLTPLKPAKHEPKSGLFSINSGSCAGQTTEDEIAPVSTPHSGGGKKYFVYQEDEPVTKEPVNYVVITKPHQNLNDRSVDSAMAPNSFTETNPSKVMDLV
jgi:hypothetical protein